MINNIFGGASTSLINIGKNFGIQKPPSQGNFQAGATGNTATGQGTNMKTLNNLDGELMWSSFRLPGGGQMTARVFKADNFSDENPIIIVRGIDVCGTKFEKEVNINNVDPHNASIVEMLALDGYFKANGLPGSTTRAFVNAMAGKEATGGNVGEISAFSTFNFVEILQNHMKLFMKNQCQNGVAWLNPILDTLMNHIEQRGIERP